MTIFSKKVLKAGALALAFAFAALQTYGQAAPPEGQAAVQTVTDETALPIGDAPNAAEGAADSGPSALGSLIRVVLVLALLCAGVWGIMVFLKKSTGVNVADDPYLKSVAQLSLGQNRSAQILSVGSRAFLVGITDRSVNLIAELDDKELIDAMNLSADKTSSASVAGFQSVIASFLTARGKPGKDRTEPSSRVFGADLIRKQRERLMNGSQSAGANPSAGNSGRDER